MEMSSCLEKTGNEEDDDATVMEEKQVEEEIEKLTNEIEQIKTAMEELGKVKEETESKLKDEVKKSRTLHKFKTQRIDRNCSQTITMLNILSTLYDEMFCIHQNCDLHNKTQDVMETYRNEFDGLMGLYERMVVGFLTPERKRFGCTCQAKMEEVIPVNDNIHYVNFLEKKCPCYSEEHSEGLTSEQEEGEEEFNSRSTKESIPSTFSKDGSNTRF